MRKHANYTIQFAVSKDNGVIKQIGKPYVIDGQDNDTKNENALSIENAIKKKKKKIHIVQER